MTSRSKRVLNSAPNLEHEIERNREQEEWEKVCLFHQKVWIFRMVNVVSLNDQVVSG